MAHALKIDRMDMLMRQYDLTEPEGFFEMIERRLANEPVPYITGTQAFWDLQLAVTPDVLIPRADSETLIEAAEIAFAGRADPARIADLGTGSGALILAALSIFPKASGVAIDASEAALKVAAHNASATGLSERLQLHHLSWRKDGWQKLLGGPFDLLLCNPPYVENNAPLSLMVQDYEPHAALYAGPDGLDDYRLLVPAMPSLLAPGGVAIFEIGASQADAVAALSQAAGMTCDLRHDIAGNPRALVMRNRD